MAGLLAAPLVIVGGTPGGLYRLIKQGAARGRQLDWSDAYFDLVVVDEASQMSLAEALTAAAFLRDDGQFLAVGDHRQMPPIVQHDWAALRASLDENAVVRDHRSVGLIAFDRGQWVQSWKVTADQAPDVTVQSPRILAWNGLGRVVVNRMFGTLREGGQFENLLLCIMTRAGDRVRNIEFFDVHDGERALARFTELTTP